MAGCLDSRDNESSQPEIQMAYKTGYTAFFKGSTWSPFVGNPKQVWLQQQWQAGWEAARDDQKDNQAYGAED
jgi:hypothetical protein